MNRDNRLVLGIAGYAQTGKDMVGSTIRNMCTPRSIQILKLASPLREIVKKSKVLPRHLDVYSEDPKIKEEVRPFLVKQAQDLRKTDPLYFTKRLVDQIDLSPENQLQIVTDVRYEDEVDYLSECYPNFEFIMLHRNYMTPATDEEERYTTPLYNSVSQYKNGASLFIPELSKYLTADQEFMSNAIVTAALISEVLTKGLPDFSKNKLFISEQLTPKSYNSMQTVAELGIDLNFLEENYL